MDLVVDTNVLISATLHNGLTRKLVFSNDLTLYAPMYFLAEFSQRQEEIVAKAERELPVFNDLFWRIRASVHVVPASELNPYKREAERLCPHFKDWPFFAVALLKNCGIWSEERRLKRQDAVPVYSTADFAVLL